MNLEPRVTSKGMWWDGQYGGVIKNGQFAMLYRKPNLENIGVFDSIICFPAASTDKAYNHVVHNGVTHDLSNDEINYVDSQIDLLFPDSGGGGGGGTGREIVNITPDDSQRGLRLTKADGSTSVVAYSSIKATNLEYYLDVSNADLSQTMTIPFAKGVDVVIPIGSLNLTGRHLYMTIDPATNRIVVPTGGTRLTLRMSLPVRFSPSVKDSMVFETSWWFRRLNSSEPWEEIARGTHSRTSSQTTAALSLGTSVTAFQMPDYPAEIEVRAKLVDEGTTGINWVSKEFFTEADDYIKLSATKNANFEYNSNP
ncbi:MAG: hypothetical protein ACRDDF_05920 [Aeromonas sp.]